MLLFWVAPVLAGAGQPARVEAGATAIEWHPLDAAAAMEVTISGPRGFYQREAVGPGGSVAFSVYDAGGALRPAGSYVYEVWAVPQLDEETRRELAAARESGGDGSALMKAGKVPAAGTIQSGAFVIRDGAILAGGETEPGAQRTQASGGNRLSPKDFVINDDLIVTGSSCVGFDCVNGETFSFDTIKLKENNLRIKFEDTSVGSFPTRDWQITANDSASGGLDKFSVEDITAARVPFTIEGNADANSLYVDTGKRIGIGTNSPVLNLHIKSGNSPAVRLEQDTSSGFPAQTWDIAGNEVNFFVRDVTNGSKLSFRIQPGAPSNSLFVASSGNVGINNSVPTDLLHVNATAANGGVLITSSTNLPQLTINNAAVANSDGNWRFRVNSTGNFVFTHADADATTPLVINPESNTNLLVLNADAVQVTGRVVVNGGQVHPDYVFEPGYALESIEEHAASMWAAKHLPAIGAGTYQADGKSTVDLVGHQFGIVEELEKAHIYIEQLHRTVQSLEERLAQLESDSE